MPDAVLRPLGRWIARSRADADPASDEALAERVRATGDTTAFAVLVGRYRGRLIVLARRMLAQQTGAPDEAEDVAQEAFVAAYHKRGSFRSGAAFRPWLYRIAVNRCLDRLRAHSRQPWPGDFANVPEPAAPHENDPLRALLSEEREERLQQAMASLPPHYRAVFVLRYLDDLAYEEIAAATGLPLGTVKTHLFRARAHLRRALRGYLEP